MGADGTYRQVGLSGVFRVVSNHIPHGRRSRLLLAPLLVLQTRAGGPPGHAEDILRRTLRAGIQSGCLYLRTLHDFAHRRLHRYNHAAHRHHDRLQSI